MALGDLQAQLVGVFRQRDDGTRGADSAQHLADLRERHAHLARGNRRELVQDLDADNPTTTQLLLGAIGPSLVA
jgi:hypothetical protein